MRLSERMIAYLDECEKAGASAPYALINAWATQVRALERRSITEAVPSGWTLFCVQLNGGEWEANLCHRIQFENQRYGTGPTPESAVADAVEKVKPHV